MQFWADGQPTIIVRTIITTLVKTGLEALLKRFGRSRVIQSLDLAMDFAPATAGDIAAINLGQRATTILESVLARAGPTRNRGKTLSNRSC